MATQALILITAEQGQVLPPHLFAPIVGLPFLNRLIFSLWRAGISRVCLMVPAAARAQLEKRLARVKGSAGGTLEVFSRWRDLPLAASNNREDGSILVMSADMLATPAYFAEFPRSSVPAAGLALAVTECQARAQPPGGRAEAIRVSLERRLVISLGVSTRSDNHCALSLAMFSRPSK